MFLSDQIRDVCVPALTFVENENRVILCFYFFLYDFFPRTAHRMIHYFEDEAVKSYSEYLSLVQKGVIENINAPKIAIEYYNLDNEAKLSDMIIRVREDEMRHSEKNLMFSMSDDLLT